MEDIIRLHLILGRFDFHRSDLGFDWPPPKHIYFPANGYPREARPGDKKEFTLVRTNMSDLPAEIAETAHIARAAEYRYLDQLRRPLL